MCFYPKVLDSYHSHLHSVVATVAGVLFLSSLPAKDPMSDLRSSPDGDASDLASDSFNYCASSSSSPSSSATCSSSRLQFFVRMISEGNTIVVHANSEDTVKSLHERIHVMTGIPV
ncbi:hypothetical protein SLA2020_516340 [Shorea laevis]